MSVKNLDSTYVLKRPLITEKGTHEANGIKSRGSTAGQPLNRYSFLVDIRATKPQIKAAVEDLYKVRVVQVRTQIRKGVDFRTRYGTNRTPDWKRATVELHVEDKIELF
jgi:large subunit ribosomal protein L23